MIIKDQFGELVLPKDARWGKNTQRSLQNFPIGTEQMPEPLIHMLLELKRACAISNGELEQLDEETAAAIVSAIDDILNDDVETLFPLSVWQTGSGTQTNMNANEVIAQTATMRIHPNDDVNCGQSSNDVFPSVLHMMTVMMVTKCLLPSLEQFSQSLEALVSNYGTVLKTGRTHLQDATPLSFGQEVSGWNAMVQFGIKIIEEALEPLRYLAIGGTAVGTGLNTIAGFDASVCNVLSDRLGFEFKPSSNKFHELSSKDAMLHMHSALSTTATNLMKIANDIRWLASGPRTGLGELTLPANEPGSSIMPGKVNPTQIEALTMVCVRVMGNQQTMMIANSQGNFELNVYMPLMGYTMWQSVRLLSDAVASTTERCLKGLMPNVKVMSVNLRKTLMTATHLNQHLGYDVVTQIVNEAHEMGVDIKTVILKHAIMSEAEFDQLFDVHAMIKPQ